MIPFLIFVAPFAVIGGLFLLFRLSEGVRHFLTGLAVVPVSFFVLVWAMIATGGRFDLFELEGDEE